MISNTRLTLVIIFNIFFIHFISAQCTTFNNSPLTKSELDESNCYLAHKFAPVLFQFANSQGDDDNDNNRDIPTKVNYDNNFNHLNNWDNVGALDNDLPSAYYDVVWTNQLYIITYTYYYPRDWSINGSPLCHPHNSQHEGDTERVVVYI